MTGDIDLQSLSSEQLQARLALLKIEYNSVYSIMPEVAFRQAQTIDAQIKDVRFEQMRRDRERSK